MKKSFLIFSLVVMFVVILFANTSFAEPDSEVVDFIMSNAEITIEEGTIRDNNGVPYKFNAPKMVFTNEAIQAAEEKYGVDIIINGGNIYIGENLRLGGYIWDRHIVGDNLRSYPITVSAPSGQDIISDQSDGLSFYNSYVNTNDLYIGGGLGELTGTMSYKEGQDVQVTFYGSAATESFKNGGYNNYYGNPAGVSVNAKVTDSSGNTISGREDKTESKINNPVIDVRVENETSGSLSLTDENTYEDENGNRRVMINIPENGEGAYAFQIIGPDGQPIQLENGMMIYDADGNPISTQYMDGDLFSGALNPGYYYIELPEGAATIKTKRMTDNTAITTEGLSTITNTDNFLTESEKKNWVADFFEKVFFWFVMAMGAILSGLISVIAGENLSIDKLVFDQYGNTALSFFKNDSGVLPNNPLLEGAVDPLNYIFNAFVGIAVVCYMIILVYMGIRVLFMSTADRKARYKEVLVDWVKGIAIIYLFPFIIRFAILLNHAFVDYIYDNLGDSLSAYSASIPSSSGGLGNASAAPMDSNGSSYMVQMFNLAMSTNRLTYALCWMIMLIQVIQFLIVYLKRLITVMFLIAIFPLVSISYAIDKIGDGKSQAFNHWCKEFILQVFIQSFHAMNYVIVMGLVFKILAQDGTINWFLAIVGITYVAKGGDILRGLFAQMGGGGAGGPMQVAGALLKTQATISAIKGVKNTVAGMVGSQSPVGRGINKIGQAYDGYLQGSTSEKQGQARKAIEQNRISAQNRAKSTILTDTQKVLREGTTTPINDLKNVIDTFSNMSEAERNEVLQHLDEGDRGTITDLLTHATAYQIVRNRDNARAVDVRTSVEILINDRTKGGNELIDKYDTQYTLSNVSQMYKSGELRRIGDQASVAAASFEVNQEAVDNRPAPPRMPTGTEDKLNYALRRIRSAVEKGDSTIDELHECKEVVENARNSGNQRLIDIIEKAEDDMGFTMDDFSTNLAIQTVNHSRDEDITGNKKKMDRYNASVREIRKASKDDRNSQVLKMLRANVDDLHEGYLPELRDRSETQEVERNVYTAEGEEYTEYLIQKGREMKKNARRDAAIGAIKTAGGAITGGAKLGLGIATAGIASGASVDTSKQDNILEQVTMAGTSGFNIGSGVVDKIGRAASTARGVGSDVVDTVHAITGRPAQDSGTPDYETNRKSIELNNQYYQQRSATNEAARRVEKAERDSKMLRDLLKYKK